MAFLLSQICSLDFRNFESEVLVPEAAGRECHEVTHGSVLPATTGDSSCRTGDSLLLTNDSSVAGSSDSSSGVSSSPDETRTGSFRTAKTCLENPDSDSSTQDPDDEPDVISDGRDCTVSHADWWHPADISAWRTADILANVSKLCSAEVVRHSSDQGAGSPWLPGKSGALYEEMGAVSVNSSYLAVWLKLNDASLVFLSSLPQSLAPDVTASNFLDQRNAETVGPFFGRESTSTSITRTAGGVTVSCIQIDLYSRWLMRVALQQAGFCIGNTLELILVDWCSKTVLASLRLVVTQNFLDLLT
eukprot:gb/GFBE01041360.1/.p1 GENE.gb/GFBE01041360.1/~~gb/GFBE01041360.1/.p1  ORF type:complete len:303 (+),score=53.63 gb/GFBE01041360.1/:1-909(+)